VIEIMRCPNCGVRLEINGAEGGRIITCVHCGVSFASPSFPGLGPVIDVHAEPVVRDSPETESPEPEFENAGASFLPDAPHSVSRDWDPPEDRFYTFRAERLDTGGPGCCCGFGCLLALLIMMLALRGCISLF